MFVIIMNKFFVHKGSAKYLFYVHFFMSTKVQSHDTTIRGPVPAKLAVLQISHSVSRMSKYAVFLLFDFIRHIKYFNSILINKHMR